MILHLLLLPKTCYVGLKTYLLGTKSLKNHCKYLNVLLKQQTTWNHLKPSETTWNQLKPPETTQKLPENTWNKPYYSIFLFKINYSQVEFVLILHPKVFFGKIWSRKLKFSKLTKICQRGALLYPHFKFNVYFSKIFVTLILLGKFGPKTRSSPN